MASHFQVSSKVWLACFMTAELFCCCCFFNFLKKYCLLMIGQTWRLWCCLAQTIKTTLPWSLLVPFADFQKWGWGVSRTVWGTFSLYPPPLGFEPGNGQSHFFILKRKRWSPRCPGSWKVTVREGSPDEKAQLSSFSVASVTSLWP